MSIQYLQRNQVDTAKWDHCIDNASNGLIYGYSFYLDHMSKNWDALVMGDYEAVMPLTWNKKWGIYYLYQPAFTASLGLFGNEITKTILHQFIRAIPPKFRLVEIEMNYANNLSIAISFFIRNNYVLDLERSYEELSKNYKENIRRNIKKAQQLNMQYKTEIPVEEVIDLSKKQMESVAKLTAADYNNFHYLFDQLHKQGKAVTTGIYSKAGELMASCVYFFSHGRAYYILVGNHPDGKTMGASHYLIDRFIHEHAGQKLKLDFEGSDIRNLAFFYSSFGSEVEQYPSLRLDRLPWYVRLMR